MTGRIRCVLGEVDEPAPGSVYCHEHLVIDSRLIATEFPHIHLHDVEAAVAEVESCRAAGAALMVDAMPMSSGRDVVRLAEISRRAGVPVVAATGLHHDRYYGPGHWTNRVDEQTLADLFVADLVDGIDELDCTGPVVRRTEHRAGVVKVATSGVDLDARDRRNLRAVAAASLRTGAPVLTHCEGGLGGEEQVAALDAAGVAPSRVILSHVDKADDLGYLVALAQTGAYVELDQTLRQAERGTDSVSVRAVAHLAAAGLAAQVVVGTDGARRSLWRSLGGAPGLAWLAAALPAQLRSAGLDAPTVEAVMRANALRALRWTDPA